MSTESKNRPSECGAARQVEAAQSPEQAMPSLSFIERLTETLGGILEQVGEAVENEHIPPSNYFVAGGR